MALTSISMSEPKCRFCDSRYIYAAAEKLPLRSATGELDGDDDMTRSRVGDWGTSAKLVMQSMTRTRLLLDLPREGSTRNSERDVLGFTISSEMWMTV